MAQVYVDTILEKGKLSPITILCSITKNGPFRNTRRWTMKLDPPNFGEKQILWTTSELDWLSSSPDFNPLDCHLWSVLESKLCSKHQELCSP